MSDTREALTYLLADHRFLRHTSSEGDVCYCGWRDQDEPHGRHQADVLEAAFLVVPRSELTIEYGIVGRNGVPVERNALRAEVARYRAVHVWKYPSEAASYRQLWVGPWSPLPEDGER